MGARRGGVYGRIAVTVLAPLAGLWIARIPSPGVDVSVWAKAPGFDPTVVGIGALALHQLPSAALLIEVLALLIPRWRVLRLGGYDERSRLWTRVVIVWLIMILLQSFFMMRWLVGTARALAPFAEIISGERTSLTWIATQILSLTAGSIVIFWLARWVDRYGTGNGLAVMMVAFLAADAIPALLSSASKLPGERILVPLCLAAVAVAAVTRVAGGRPLKASAQPPGGERLPTPASGLHPVAAAAAALTIPMSIAKIGDFDLPQALAAGSWQSRIVEAALVGALCLLLTWLFNRPRLIAQAWKRGVTTDADRSPVADRVRAAFARSLALALAICWVVMAVGWFCADSGLVLSVVTLTMFACVATDVAGESRFRRRHGALVAVWPVHRLFLLPGFLKALDAAGIPAFARARRARTLWNFMAPYLPVDILVPAAQAGPAETILRVAADR